MTQPTYSFRHTDMFSPIEVFSVPTSKFIGHELTVWLPYFIKRHIFRRNIPKPPAIIATADEAQHKVKE